MERVVSGKQDLARLVLVADTLHVLVGESVKPEAALRLTALDADGSDVARVVPLYTFDASSVVDVAAGGLRGVGVGVTRVLVRLLMRDVARRGRAEVSTSLVVKVRR